MACASARLNNLMRIELANIKKISKLTFDVPVGGVWIVTGLNGSGKTSLFAALYRISYPSAYASFFKAGPLGGKLDSFDNASVTYTLDDGRSVTYRYGGQRWRARPRREIAVLDSTPFEAVLFIDANPRRIEPFPDEIPVGRRPTLAREPLRSFMSHVLADTKWDGLVYVNTRRGTGSEAFLIPYSLRGRVHYFSEKSFSLGELCALKLARQMLAAPDNSLILIDEVEMALHPQAQVRLFERISEIADQKGLTVIFSTHSATLIKSAERKRLIFLQDDGVGNISVASKVYPAAILGDLAFSDEVAVDYVFYVEDVKAKHLLGALIQIYYQNILPVGGYLPSYRIVPVGGYDAVMRMLESSATLLPRYVKAFCLLDADVLPLVAGFNPNLSRIYGAHRNEIMFLMCTPELGLVELLESGGVVERPFIDMVEAGFPGFALNVRRLVALPAYLALTNANPRDQAKHRLAFILEHIVASTHVPEHQILSVLYLVYAKYIYATRRREFMQLLAPILNPV